MTKILIMRHGESDANKRKILTGRHDAPLTDLGRAQARQAAEQLEFKPTAIISSPLVRALDTAQIVADTIGYQQAITTDDRLVEFNVGDRSEKPNSGVTSEQLLATPNAEPIEEFVARLKNALNEIAKIDGPVLVVAHGGVMRLYQCLEKGLDPKVFYDLPRAANTGVISIDAKKILNSSNKQ